MTEKLKADYLTKLRAPAAIADYLLAARDAKGDGTRTSSRRWPTSGS